MTVAIKGQDNTAIWFAAVLQYNRQFSSSVSKHPIENGSNISDNTTTENPIYSISGIVSDTDFYQLAPFQLRGSEDRDVSPRINGVSVTITEGGIGISKYLPEMIGQFLDERAPEVTVLDLQANNTAEVVERLLETKWRAKELFTILEYQPDKLAPTTLIPNCVITSLSFSEDPDSGDALHVEITLEQVRTVHTVAVPVKVTAKGAVKNAASAETSKSTQTGSTAAGTVPPDGLPKKDQSALNQQQTNPVGSK